MAHIASVSVGNACVPLHRITSFATRTVKVRYYCLVKIRSSDDVEGLGYCYAGNSAGNTVHTAVQELLAPMLIGDHYIQPDQRAFPTLGSSSTINIFMCLGLVCTCIPPGALSSAFPPAHPQNGSKRKKIIRNCSDIVSWALTYTLIGLPFALILAGL